MIRLLGLLLVLLGGITGIAAADQGSGDDEAPVVHEQDAGTVEGRVVAIDHAQGTMTIATAHGRYEVLILPSTSIRNDEGFDTIADIRRGERVEVFMSKRDSVYVAQIIRLHGDH